MNLDDLGRLALAGFLAYLPNRLLVKRRQPQGASQQKPKRYKLVWRSFTRRLIHFLPKTRRTRPLCGDDNLKILLGYFKVNFLEVAISFGRGAPILGVQVVNQLDIG